MKWNSSTYVLLMLVIVFALPAQTKTVTTRKVQEVNFSEMSLKGTVRNPDGAYLVQKRGLKFQPIYKIQESFDQKLRDTHLYIE